MTVQPEMQRVLEDLRARQQEWHEALEPFRRVWRELPADAQFVQRYLAERGWYVPAAELPIGVFAQLREFIRQGKDDEIESLVQHFAESQIERVMQGVKQYYPHRHAIVADAVEAHRTEKFTLSVPVLLAQADGLTHELLGVSVFGKKSGRPKTEEALRALLDEQTLLGTVVPLNQLSQLLLNPLMEPSSLIADTADVRDRQKGEPAYGPLNRHGVLHGLDVDYATEANSLRAVLLMDYLLEVRGILVGHQEWVENIKRGIGEA